MIASFGRYERRWPFVLLRASADRYESVTALRTLSPPLSIKWFPTLFTAFFKMLCNMKTNASLCALQTMVFLVDRYACCQREPNMVSA